MSCIPHTAAPPVAVSLNALLVNAEVTPLSDPCMLRELRFNDWDEDGFPNLKDPVLVSVCTTWRDNQVAWQLDRPSDCNDLDRTLYPRHGCPSEPAAAVRVPSYRQPSVVRNCTQEERRWRDRDQDGYGDPTAFIDVSVCALWEEGFVLQTDDCNDKNPRINPQRGC